MHDQNVTTVLDVHPLDNGLVDAQQGAKHLALRTPFPVHRFLTFRQARNLSGNGVLLSDLSHAKARYVVSQLSVAQVPDATVLGDGVAVAVGLDASLLSHRRHFLGRSSTVRAEASLA